MFLKLPVCVVLELVIVNVFSQDVCCISCKCVCVVEIVSVCVDKFVGVCVLVFKNALLPIPIWTF